MYRKAEQLTAALAACERWGCWQQAFALSAELNQSPEEKTKLAHRIANTLRQKRQYKEAAQVLMTYAHDLEEAIIVLLEGGAWVDALCLVSIKIGFIIWIYHHGIYHLLCRLIRTPELTLY